MALSVTAHSRRWHAAVAAVPLSGLGLEGSVLQAVGTTDKLIRSKFGSMLTAEKALNWKRIFDNADAPVRD